MCYKSMHKQHTLLPFKSLGKKMYTFQEGGIIKLIKSNSKGIYNVTKIYLTKFCSSELFIHQIIINVSQFPQKY